MSQSGLIIARCKVFFCICSISDTYSTMNIITVYVFPINAKKLNFTMHLIYRPSTCPTVYVNKHLLYLTYGRIPTKGRYSVGTWNLRIKMYFYNDWDFLFSISEMIVIEVIKSEHMIKNIIISISVVVPVFLVILAYFICCKRNLLYRLRNKYKCLNVFEGNYSYF